MTFTPTAERLVVNLSLSVFTTKNCCSWDSNTQLSACEANALANCATQNYIHGISCNMCNVMHWGFFFRLLNSNNEVLFTCRIIHSVQVMSSVVHVFHRDKMAAVAHVIGADQLPMDSQVHFFLCFVICN